MLQTGIPPVCEVRGWIRDLFLFSLASGWLGDVGFFFFLQLKGEYVEKTEENKAFVDLYSTSVSGTTTRQI